MRKDNRNTVAFFALIRAGLWEQGVRLSPYGEVVFDSLYKLADEQSVVGLVAAGLEHIEDMKVTKQQALPFMKRVISLESRNLAMNVFIAGLVDKMRQAGIYSLLVKGQGVAQCYARPLWRAAGDVDFFFDADNYEKAKAFLIPLASKVDPEEKRKKHQAMTLDSWLVELHGKMPTELSSRINAGIDEVQDDIFYKGRVRRWDNDGVDVFLPNADNDVIIIFTHFIQHFYVGGVGLRQICDWCRLLYTYKNEIDRDLLMTRLKKMGLMTEWTAFASYAVEFLDMPKDSMPFYNESGKNTRRAKRICRLVLKTGNFGHNIDASYRSRYPYLVQKTITFWRRLGEFLRLFTIFPTHAPKYFATYVLRRTSATF